MEGSPLEVSRYDQVAGSLVSVLIVMGVLVVVMFVLWLASLPVRIPTAAPVRVLEDVGGGGFGDTFTPGMQREFFERVRSAYLRIAAAEPQRVRVLDAGVDAAALADGALAALSDLLPPPAAAVHSDPPRHR